MGRWRREGRFKGERGGVRWDGRLKVGDRISMAASSC